MQDQTADALDPVYQAREASESRFFALRGLRYHVRCWGQPVAGQAPLVLVHGWMDVGASFQFLVDALAEVTGGPRAVFAPDWRGFGLTDVGGGDSYWFPDYLADLDALLDALSPNAPVDLLGHSMGGNVVMVYAGLRPHRVRRLVNLEGFGLPDAAPVEAPDRLVRWLDELRQPARLRDYASRAEVAERLRANNPRLGAGHAAWLAGHWAHAAPDGRWHVRGDPAHKRVNPIGYRAQEAVAAWRRITAPVLWVEAAAEGEGGRWSARYPRSEFEARLAVVPEVRRLVLADCGHMVHHDQPVAVARALRDFL